MGDDEMKLFDDGGNIQIDPEALLQAILAVTADEAQKQELLQGISERTGVALADVEEIADVLIQFLLESTRSN